uniref:Uncharacterized protein n=1 Tax=Denticeps clupeoides TaxID=299321 RepID=A0AAY4CI06_9TELE
CSAPARPHHIFGLRRGVARPLWFADERTLLLPAGRGCVRYDLEQRGQTFIPGNNLLIPGPGPGSAHRPAADLSHLVGFLVGHLRF